MNKISTFYNQILKGTGPQGKLISPVNFHASFTFAGPVMGSSSSTNGGAFLKQFVPEDLGYMIQDIQAPNWLIKDGLIPINTPIGMWVAPSNSFVGVDNGVLTLSMFDTEKPIFEEFFLPWMELVVAHSKEENAFSYSFLKATFYVKVTSSDNNIPLYNYKFHNVFPYVVDARNFDQKSTEIPVRKVALSCTDMEYERLS